MHEDDNQESCVKNWMGGGWMKKKNEPMSAVMVEYVSCVNFWAAGDEKEERKKKTKKRRREEEKQRKFLERRKKKKRFHHLGVCSS